MCVVCITRNNPKKEVNMKRRLITTIIAALAAVACAFVFAACSSYKPADNHPADTFYAGALSAETYASPELAAKAFIDAEVSGDVTDATFVSYTKTADLTEEEVEALDIPAAEKAEIASVEKGEVKYTVASNASVLTSASDEKQYIVVIVKYNNQTVKYYSPVLNTGDPLTKSYYDQVFSPDNFKNVTISYKMDIPINVSTMGLKFTTKTNMKINAKWDEDTYGYVKAEMVMDLGSLGALAGAGSKTKIVTEQFYVNDKTSRFYECSFSRITSEGKTSEWSITGRPKDPDWTYDESDESGESSDDEGNEDNEYDEDYDWDDDWDFGDDEDDGVLTKFLPAFDYSYFVKTKTGFKINSEKLSESLDIILQDAFDQSGMGSIGIKLGKTSATANYYVSDGKITESVVTANCKYSLDSDGIRADYNLKEKLVIKYTDYGKTVVSVPGDIDFDSYL